jgi:5-methylcytosine-specific restriction endonuclease McrA
MREYMLRRYHARMQEAITFLGGKCKCGLTEGLQLDHIDPATKSFTIAKMWSLSKEKFWIEVRKCQLLCQECHSDKTRKDLGQQDARKTHGTLSSYRYCRCPECKAAQAEYMRDYHLGR